MSPQIGKTALPQRVKRSSGLVTSTARQPRGISGGMQTCQRRRRPLM
jgi:hypothetical protein